MTVYADGPTRVLRFSDDRNLSSQEARNAIRDLAARLKQVGGHARLPWWMGVGWAPRHVSPKARLIANPRAPL